MITYTTIEQEIVDSNRKHISWLFDITTSVPVYYYWSTKTKSFVYNNSQKKDYTFKIIADSFQGITVNRAKPEYGVQTPNEISFQVTNKDNLLTASDFIGARVDISIVGSKYTTSELLTNVGFETHTGSQDDGIEDAFTGYVIAGTNGTIDSTTTIHSGSNAIKITAGAAVDKQISQTVTVTAGEHYSFSFWHKEGSAGAVARYSVYDITHAANIVAITSTTLNSTSSFSYIKIDFTVPAGCTSIKLILYCSDTNGEIVYYDDLSLTYAEMRLRCWSFIVTRCESFYQTLTFTCEDYLQHYFRTDYPKGLVKNLFPHNNNLIDDNYTFPVTFGTAYLPLRLIINSAGEEYYFLGNGDYTYIVSKQRVPRGAQVGKYEWTSDDYTFAQTTTTDEIGTSRKILRNNIDNGNNIIFVNGDHFFDVPTEIVTTIGIAGNDQSTTAPGFILFLCLYDITVNVNGYIPSGSYVAANAVFTTWGLAWNGGFYKSEPAEKIVGKLMNMCHMTIESYGTLPLALFKILSKTSQKTITKAEVLKTSDQGFGTFKYSAISPELYDSGYVAYQEFGEGQDEFVQILVPTKQGGTTANPSSEVLELPFIGDSVTAQKLGILYYQRKYLKMADISFSAKGTLLALQPDDVITINDTDYGGSYDVLIDSISFKKDLTLEFRCIRFSQSLDDYTDLNPTAITPTPYQELQRNTKNYAAPERRLMERFAL